MTPPIIENNKLESGLIITAKKVFPLTGVRLKKMKKFWEPVMYFSNHKQIRLKDIAMIVFPKGFVYTVFF